MKKTWLLFLGLVLIFGVIMGFWLISQGPPSFNKGVSSCSIQALEKEIKGHSLEPLIKDGAKVKVLVGYYNCYSVKRGDIVALNFKTQPDLFAKKVVGLPGDELTFLLDSFIINGQIATNSQGQPYLLDQKGKTLLGAPLKQNRLSGGQFLVLSEERNPSSFDCRRFGLISQKQILGKIVFQ